MNRSFAAGQSQTELMQSKGVSRAAGAHLAMKCANSGGPRNETVEEAAAVAASALMVEKECKLDLEAIAGKSAAKARARPAMATAPACNVHTQPSEMRHRNSERRSHCCQLWRQQHHHQQQHKFNNVDVNRDLGRNQSAKRGPSCTASAATARVHTGATNTRPSRSTSLNFGDIPERIATSLWFWGCACESGCSQMCGHLMPQFPYLLKKPYFVYFVYFYYFVLVEGVKWGLNNIDCSGNRGGIVWGFLFRIMFKIKPHV